MEIAAISTVSVAPQSRQPSNTLSRKLGSVSSLTLPSIEREHRVGKSTRLRVSAASSSSMDAVTAEKISPASFLDKREESRKVVHFVKYHGLGNDFILVDNRDSSEPKVTQEQAAKLCDRNFGVGADGVIFAMPGVNGADYTMRIFNSDGNVCFTMHTGAGLIVPEIQDDGQVKVDMGIPILKAQDVPTKLPGTKGEAVVQAELVVDGVSWNNLKVDDLNLPEIGPKFEHHEMFPARTNTEFVEVLSRSHLKMRVWERGAGATLACGTGACALVVAAVLEGRANRKCTVDLPGGPLEIEWRQEDNHIYMTGPAEAVFYGSALL
ncbi:hypothetical protein Bca101_045612 [Brassica carinata]